MIAGACLLIYWPALRGDWLWDDDTLVTKNALIADPSGLWKIWFAPRSMIDFQPIEVSVVWIEWRLWGNQTAGHHALNLLLHFINALLIWRLLGRFKIRLAWLGGLLFAVHPQMVESVAWIAELEDTLSLPPFLLAMTAWVDYEDRGRRRDYLLALGLFLVAILCKATMVMFPVVILLYAWWKRGRDHLERREGRRAMFSDLGGDGGGHGPIPERRAGQDPRPLRPVRVPGRPRRRLARVYLGKALLPVCLLPTYPRWEIPPAWWQLLTLPLLAMIFFCLWTRRATWGRHALLGLGFFVVMLLPFAGFTATSYMDFTWVMDHMVYIPIVGLVGLAAAALDRAAVALPKAYLPFGLGVTVLVIATLAWGAAITPRPTPARPRCGATRWSATRARGWRRIITDWLSTTKAMPPRPFRTSNRRSVSATITSRPATISAWRSSPLARRTRRSRNSASSVAANPTFPDAHYNYGFALIRTGHTVEAIAQFREALRLKPTFLEASNNLAAGLFQIGHLREAIAQCEESLKIAPGDPVAQHNLEQMQKVLDRTPTPR